MSLPQLLARHPELVAEPTESGALVALYGAFDVPPAVRSRLYSLTDYAVAQVSGLVVWLTVRL